MTTKIAALVDAPGNLVRFTLLPGQRHDIKSVDDLLEGIDCEAFLGDKAFDAKALRARLAQDGIKAVIPQRKGAAELIDYDRKKYKCTHPARTTDGSVFFCSRSPRSVCDDVMDLSLCGVAFLWESSPASKPQ